jgi:transposase-like protein
MTKEVEEVVAGFSNRPLDQGPFICLWLDAINQRYLEG